MNFTASESLSGAWATYSTQKQRSATAADVHRHENVYAKGYFLTDGKVGDFIPADWEKITVNNGYSLAVSPDLPYEYLEGPGVATLVLGHAFLKDEASFRTAETATSLLSSLAVGTGFKNFEEVVLGCSGRFVALAFKSGELRVYTDPMASKTCFWAQRGRLRKSTYLASHSALIALATGQTESTEKTWIMTHPEYISPAGKALPALIAPHDVSREVFANCYLSIRGSKVSHTRYFPTHKLPNLSVEEATSIFVEEMRFNTEAWLSVTDHAYLALTAGQDSRAILSTSLDLFNAKPDDVTMMTYHFFEKGTPTTALDLLKANQLALDAKLRFKTVNIGTFDDALKALYNTTFSGWARFPTLASAFYHQLQANSALFIGIGGEIGTGFFSDRSQQSITSEWLSRKFTTAAVGKSPELIAKFQDYIEYTQFRDERLCGYDLHDLFYWEHRLTKWAGASYAEYDLSATVALPFNSRRLLLAMLSLPYEQRVNKAIYSEVVKRSGIV